MLPAASLACRVRVLLEPEEMVLEDTATVEVFTEAGPGVTVREGATELTNVPPIVAVILVALPARSPVN